MRNSEILYSMIGEAEREFGKPSVWRIGSDRLSAIKTEPDFEGDLIGEGSPMLCGVPVTIDPVERMRLELVTDRGVVSDTD